MGLCFLTLFDTSKAEQAKAFQLFSNKPHALQDDMGGHGVAIKVRQVKSHSDSRTGMPNPPLTT